MANLPSMPLDNLTDLLVFIRVADACSFTLAAEAGHFPIGGGQMREPVGGAIGHPAAAAHHAQRQPDRRRRGVLRVCAAHPVAGRRGGNGAEYAAANAARAAAAGSAGLVGAIAYPADSAGVLAQWPEVDADVSFSDEYSDLVRDGIDVAVRVGGSDDSRLVRRVLAPHRLITCAAPDYLARHGTPAKPEALGEHETLVFSHQGLPAPWRYLVNGQLHEQPVRGRMRFNNVEALRDAAVAGAGLCQVGAFLVGEQIAAGTLVPVLERYCRPGPPICAVYPSRRHLSPR